MSDREEQESAFDAHILWYLAVVVGLFLSYPLLLKLGIGEWKGPGEFGDLYGGLNTLFSGIAITLLIGTLMLQRKELRLQREEIVANRLELANQAKSLQAQAATLQQQYNLLKHQMTPIGWLQLPSVSVCSLINPREHPAYPGFFGRKDLAKDIIVMTHVLFVNIAPTPIYLKPLIAQSVLGCWTKEISKTTVLGPIRYGEPIEVGIAISFTEALATDIQVFATDYIGTRWDLSQEDLDRFQQLVQSKVHDKLGI